MEVSYPFVTGTNCFEWMVLGFPTLLLNLSTIFAYNSYSDIFCVEVFKLAVVSLETFWLKFIVIDDIKIHIFSCLYQIELVFIISYLFFLDYWFYKHKGNKNWYKQSFHATKEIKTDTNRAFTRQNNVTLNSYYSNHYTLVIQATPVLIQLPRRIISMKLTSWVVYIPVLWTVCIFFSLLVYNFTYQLSREFPLSGHKGFVMNS